LCILHTNDLHGCFEGPEGKALQAVFEEQIQQARLAFNGNVLLFDSGDQLGIPQAESRQIEAMASLGYDAVALGNQDLKHGVSNLFKQYNYDKIKVLSSNYRLTNTILDEKTRPFSVFEREGLRIGVFALNNYYNSFIFNSIHTDFVIYPPIETARALSQTLRKDLRCDLVVCLSHLGFNAANQSCQDVHLAAQSSGIDFILGGNSHTFLEAPKTIYNADSQNVVVSQAGCGGLLLGRIDLEFNTDGRFRITRQEYIPTGASIMA
jgi:5'-nucleotidase